MYMWGNSKPMYSNFPYDTFFCIQMVVYKCKVVGCVKVIKDFYSDLEYEH